MNKLFIVNVVIPALMILSYIGLISIGCLIGGMISLFQVGTPLWFSIVGITIGCLGLFSTYHHLTMVWDAYKRIRDEDCIS